MSVKENTALVRNIYAHWNERHFEKNSANATADVQWLNVATGQVFKGLKEYLQFQQAWATAFPDARVEILRVIASEDSAAVEFVGRGTHNGVLKTPAGDIAATGKKVEIYFCDVFEFRNGKIAAGRTYFDAATMLRQLGLAS